MLTHQALLYDDEEDFAEGAVRFLLEGLGRSEPALALTERRKLALLKKRLGADAGRVELVDSARAYPPPGVPLEMFTAFMDKGLREGAVWVRVLGEPPWGMKSASEVRLWARYESLIYLIFGSPTSILCPYDTGPVRSRGLNRLNRAIRRWGVGEVPQIGGGGSGV